MFKLPYLFVSASATALVASSVSVIFTTKLSVDPFTFAVARSLFEMPGFVISTRVLPSPSVVPLVLVGVAVAAVYSAVTVTLFAGMIKVVAGRLTLVSVTPLDSVVHFWNCIPAAGVFAAITTVEPTS